MTTTLYHIHGNSKYMYSYMSDYLVEDEEMQKRLRQFFARKTQNEKKLGYAFKSILKAFCFFGKLGKDYDYSICVAEQILEVKITGTQSANQSSR